MLVLVAMVPMRDGSKEWKIEKHLHCSTDNTEAKDANAFTPATWTCYRGVDPTLQIRMPAADQ